MKKTCSGKAGCVQAAELLQMALAVKLSNRALQQEKSVSLMLMFCDRLLANLRKQELQEGQAQVELLQEYSISIALDVLSQGGSTFGIKVCLGTAIATLCSCRFGSSKQRVSDAIVPLSGPEFLAHLARLLNAALNSCLSRVSECLFHPAFFRPLLNPDQHDLSMPRDKHSNASVNPCSTYARTHADSCHVLLARAASTSSHHKRQGTAMASVAGPSS